MRISVLLLLVCAAMAEEVPSPAVAVPAAPAPVTSARGLTVAPGEAANTPILGLPVPPLPTALTPVANEDLSGMTLNETIGRAFTSNRELLGKRSALFQARLGRNIALVTVFAPVLTSEYTAYNETGDGGNARAGIFSKAMGFEIEPYMRMGYVPNGYQNSNGVGNGFNQSDNSIDQYGTAAGISISRKLFAIAEHIKQQLPISQADIAIYTAANNLVLAGRDVELKATTSFFTVQRSLTRIAVRERRLQDAREFLVTVRDRITHGFASPLDGLYAEIDLNQAETEVISDRTALIAAEEQLNDLLNRPVTAPVKVKSEVIDAARVAAIPERDLEADVQGLIRGSEQLGSASMQAELQQLELRVARDRIRPDVTAAVTGERLATGTSAFNGNDSVENVVSLTVTWNMPLDGWRADRARYKQLTLQLADQDREISSLRSSLETRLRTNWRLISAQRRQLSLAERRLEIEQLRVAATLRRYEAGAVDNLEVTRAKQALDNAEISLLDTRIDLVLADAAYRALLPMTATPIAVEAPEARITSDDRAGSAAQAEALKASAAASASSPASSQAPGGAASKP